MDQQPKNSGPIEAVRQQKQRRLNAKWTEAAVLMSRGQLSTLEGAGMMGLSLEQTIALRAAMCAIIDELMTRAGLAEGQTGQGSKQDCPSEPAGPPLNECYSREEIEAMASGRTAREHMSFYNDLMIAKENFGTADGGPVKMRVKVARFGNEKTCIWIQQGETDIALLDFPAEAIGATTSVIKAVCVEAARVWDIHPLRFPIDLIQSFASLDIFHLLQGFNVEFIESEDKN